MTDFEAEFELYERSEALVSRLSSTWRQKTALEGKAAAAAGGFPSASSPARIQDLAIDMYEHGIVGEEDVALTQAWLKDLVAVGYTFNPPAATTAVGGEGKAASNVKPAATGEEERQAAFAADDLHNSP